MTGHATGAQEGKNMQKKTIYFKLFGGFFYKSAADDAWVNVNEALPGISGKKACLFLKYLVVNHKRAMPASELMDTFWSEDISNDPENALQQMLYKVRKLLNNMFPEIENPLITRSKQCRWSPELTIELDLESFESLFDEAKTDNIQRTDILLKAIDLYDTGVQTIGEQDWLEALHIYYHTLFLDMCRMSVEPLQLNGQWIKVIDICDKVCALEPFADEFVVHMMQALIMLGNQKMAVSRYNTYREMLLQEYDIVPSAEVERMYVLALNSEFNNMDNQNLLQILEENDTKGAFFCTFNVFSHLVMMERRHTYRNGRPFALAIFGIEDFQMTTTTGIHKLEQVLHTGLRNCDAVTRMNVGSFLVLLSGATTESVALIAKRIEKMFYSGHKSSLPTLYYRTIELPTL